MALLGIFLQLISFVLSVLGVIFGVGGKSEENQSNRDQAIGGFVCGIIGIVFNSCCGLVWWVAATNRFALYGP
jgi:hypothetical protein